MSDDPVLQVDEVAAQLRVCVETVRRHLRAETLVGKKVGGRYYVRQSEVDRLLPAPRTSID